MEIGILLHLLVGLSPVTQTPKGPRKSCYLSQKGLQECTYCKLTRYLKVCVFKNTDESQNIMLSKRSKTHTHKYTLLYNLM